ARNDTGAENALDALLDTRNVFLRHGAADDLGFELEALARLARLNNERHGGKLAGAAGLLLVGVAVLDAPGHTLTERDLRCADRGVDLVGTAEDVDLDVEMQFAHALQDGLAGLL